MATFVKNEIMGMTLEITDRYSNVEAQGIGVSGVICSAHDSLANQVVAIKKIAKPFELTATARSTYREVHLLSNMRHDNVVNMSDVFISPSEDLYIVTECVRTDLHALLQAKQKPLEGKFIQFFIYQMLRGLKYIHSAGIIHRDLKPSNILINENCDLKIGDFGSAREQDHQMTDYVTTRYYRAPEIMLTWQKYTYAVDIWSIGCILAEMLLGRILFPGRDDIHQFTLITDFLGKPPKVVMDKIYGETTLKFVEALPDSERRPLVSVLKDADPQDTSSLAVDLVEKMLNLDPEQRISVADALRHPYLSTYQDSEDEPVFYGQLDWPLLYAKNSADEWKTHTYFEILNYHRGACDGQDNESLKNKVKFENWLGKEVMLDTY